MNGETPMRLWVVHPRAEVLARPQHPWIPPYDKVMHLVARARDEQEAREIAQGVAGNEGLGIYQRLGIEEDEVAADVWLDARYTDCTELLAEGKPGVLVIDRFEA